MSTEIEALIVIGNHFHVFFVILASLLLDRLVPLSNYANPLVFFRILFDRITLKVNSSEPKQSAIAGGLSTLSLLLPFLIIIYLIREFAHYKFIIDILLLWISLQFTHDKSLLRQTFSALSKDKKELAKNLLSTIVLRDTAPLSKLGIIKAGIECTYLRYLYQQVTPLVTFILLGPIAALTYRLLYEAHHQWHTKLEKFRHFGKVTFFISKLIQLPSSILFHSLFLGFFNPKALSLELFQRRFWLEVSHLFSVNNQTMSLLVLSLVLQKDVSGPVMYKGKKQTRERFGISTVQDGIDPDTSDLNSILNMTSLCTYIFVSAFGVLCLLKFLYEV